MKYSEKNQKIIFEVGDWVVHKPDAVIKAFKLGEIQGEVCKNSNRTVVINGRSLLLKDCRLASQDEIDAAMAERQAANPVPTADDPGLSSARGFIHKLVALLKEEGWID